MDELDHQSWAILLNSLRRKGESMTDMAIRVASKYGLDESVEALIANGIIRGETETEAVWYALAQYDLP